MKHIKTYKLFESVVDLIPLESTVNDIALELEDGGYEVLVDIIWPTKDYDEAPNGEAIRIEILSPRKESLYSKWRQDRENYAVREYNKCKNTLKRIDDFLKSKGLEIKSKDGFDIDVDSWSSYTDKEYGITKQGYDFTGHWDYVLVYEPSNALIYLPKVVSNPNPSLSSKSF